LRIFAQINELKAIENFLLMQIFNRIAAAAAVESQNIFPRVRTDLTAPQQVTATDVLLPRI